MSNKRESASPNGSRPAHIEFLADELDRRKTRNPRYSLRGFAQYLEMEPAALSRILGGKQPLSLRSTRRIAEILNLNDVEREDFFRSVLEALNRRAGQFLRSSGPGDLASPEAPLLPVTTEAPESSESIARGVLNGDLEDLRVAILESIEKMQTGHTDFTDDEGKQFHMRVRRVRDYENTLEDAMLFYVEKEGLKTPEEKV